MKRFCLIFLRYFPFIAIFVMLGVCVIGIRIRAPEQTVLLRSCIPIGLWTLYGSAKFIKCEWRRARGG